tara:strand:+ start:126 stop:437 length:312 start_codon:yes stop_codon:yes gene_type:complete
MEIYAEAGMIGLVGCMFIVMLVNLIRSQREQTEDLDEIKTSISKQETELTSTYQICVKLIDSINAFKQSTNDKMDRRHEKMMESLDDLSNSVAYLQGKSNGHK